MDPLYRVPGAFSRPTCKADIQVAEAKARWAKRAAEEAAHSERMAKSQPDEGLPLPDCEDPGASPDDLNQL